MQAMVSVPPQSDAKQIIPKSIKYVKVLIVVGSIEYVTLSRFCRISCPRWYKDYSQHRRTNFPLHWLAGVLRFAPLQYHKYYSPVPSILGALVSKIRLSLRHEMIQYCLYYHNTTVSTHTAAGIHLRLFHFCQEADKTPPALQL